MIILQKKANNKKFYFLIILLVILSFIFGVIAHDAKIAYHLKKFFIEKNIVVKNFYRSFFYNDMPYLKMDIPFKTIDYLDENISVANKYNYLTFAENNYKPAKVTYENKTFNVQVRLKGLTNFHRIGNKKSLRVRLKKDSSELTPSIMGFSDFNLMDPRRRWNEKEWLFRKVASKENLLERRYNFVKVKVNGDKSGIYSIEENFAKEFFEYNKVKPAPILSLDSDKLYSLSSLTQCCGHNYVNDHMFSPVQSKNQIYENENYNNQYNYAKKSLVDALSKKVPIGQILNLDKFGRFLALSDVFGGWHGSELTNLKLYFNPYTKLIEPIPDDMFDEVRDKHTRDFALFRIRNVAGYSIFYDRLFDDLNFLNIYYDYLKNYSNENFINNILKENKFEYDNVKKTISKDNFYYNPRTEKDLKRNAKIIREFIYPKFPIEVFKIYQDNEKFLNLDLQNNFYFPLKVRKIFINKKLYDINEVLNPKKLSLNSILDNSSFEITKKPKRKSLSIKSEFDYYNIREIEIFYTIGNNENLLSFKVPDINISDMDSEFTSNIKSYTDKIHIDEILKKIKLLNNKIYISENLIFPKDYTLEISSDVEIILEGSGNLIIQSDIIYLNNDLSDEKSKHMINFISEGDNCIIFKNNLIRVINMSFNGFSACNVSGLYLTGGVSFYQSNINVKNLLAMNNKSGDDLVNIIKSKFKISNLYLENSLYDGLDIDYSEGMASEVSCLNCGKKEGGDGIDLSHSEIFIEKMFIKNSFDKGLSIGENTNLNLKKLDVNNATVCLANKDGSHSIISSVKISNCKMGIAAFTKKNYYGFSKLEIDTTDLSNNEIDYVRDDKNKIIINGWEIIDKKFIDNNIYKKIYE